MNQDSYISRIKIGNYVEFGKHIKKWCETDAKDLPKTIGEVKKELAATKADVTFPEDRFSDSTPVIFARAKVNDEWIVRLPPADMVTESINRIRHGDGYPTQHLPRYYLDYMKTDREYDEEFLYSRIADYTIAQCA